MAWVWPTFPFRSVLSVLTCPGLPWISGELCRVSAVSFCFSDHQITRCPDHPILPSPLPRSSQIGADFKGYHPNPSQIGVGFSDFPTIGAGFSGGGLGFGFSAICQLLFACFQRPSNALLFRSGANLLLYHFVRHRVKRNRLFLMGIRLPKEAFMLGSYASPKSTSQPPGWSSDPGGTCRPIHQVSYLKAVAKSRRSFAKMQTLFPDIAQ
jgi:hypothetical protein